MFGLTIYLMYIADYLFGRKNKIFCKLCGIKLRSDQELDTHIRYNHRHDIWYPVVGPFCGILNWSV